MDRTKRVKILKRIIVGMVISMILLPTVLCIILFVRLSSLSNDFQTVIDRNAAYEEEIRSLKTQLTDQQLELDKAISDNEETGRKLIEALAVQDKLEAEPAVEAVPTRKVYLTFDDGPSGHTQEILDILDEYDVKANFFVCHTPNEDYQKYYKIILDKGHMLGIHSYTHEYDEIYSSEEAFEEDVSAIRDFVYEMTDGYLATNYRFPGGSSKVGNRISISSCIDYLNQQGLTYHDWNIASGDATNPMQDTEVIYQNATNDSDVLGDIVILMHDLGNKDTTVEALPKIIEYYRNTGAEIALLK